MSYGKVKLVLKHNKYFIESSHPDTLQFLLKDPVIRDARVFQQQQPKDAITTALMTSKAPTRAGLLIPGTKEGGVGDNTTNGPGLSNISDKKQTDTDLFTSVVGVDNDEIDEDDDNVHAFEIDDSKIDVGGWLLSFFIQLLNNNYTCRRSKNAVMNWSILCWKNTISETIL